MYLKKLEIQGFKSFAHKTVLEFEKGIISVVGPNGSGKSNFSDAIRWVLGEQSMKAIRSKKSEDVIFAGSDKKSKLGMAEVSITFDNEDRRLPLDFSEVSITRRLYRDGESEYLLNSRPVRLMDITELLAKSGYGNYSYHVISQGTIDQMIIAGPSAIKNLIEEASGVKPYYFKRERALRKLERSEQNLLRVADLVAEIEPRLRSLKRQAKKMAQRDELAAELTDLQTRYYSSQYHNLQRGITEHESQAQYFGQQIAQLEGEIGEVDTVIKSLEQQTSQHSSQYAKLQQDIRAQEKEKNRVAEELAIIRGQLKARAPVGEQNKQALQLAEHDLNNKIKNLEARVQELRHQSILHKKNQSDYQKISDKLAADIEGARKSIEAAKNPFDLSKLKEDIDRIYSRYQSLLYQIKNLKGEEDFNIFQEDATNLEIVLVRLKDRIAQVSNIQFDHNELVHLNTQLQRLFSQKEKLQTEIATITATIAANDEQEKFFQTQIQELTTEQSRVGKELKKAGPMDADEQWKDLARQETALNEEMQKYFAAITKMEDDLKRFLDAEALQKKELLDLERQFRSKQDVMAKTKDQRGLVLIEKARSDASMENLLSEIRKTLGNDHIEKVKQLSPSAIEAGLEQKVMKLRAQLELIGGVDELTMQEYKETEERYNYLTSQSQDLHAAITDLRQVIAELDIIIKKQFGNGFEQINEKFEEYFRILFSGGRARMSLLREKKVVTVPEEGNNAAAEEAVAEEEESDQPEAEEEAEGKADISGIDIRATPPGKKLTTLSALSGGERTLTAIALLMSILTVFPSPFVVLDEVDAALDEANSIRFGKILSRLAHQTQFITITHNRETMRQAGMLYGVTMGDEGISRVLSIKLDHAVEIAQ